MTFSLLLPSPCSLLINTTFWFTDTSSSGGFEPTKYYCKLKENVGIYFLCCKLILHIPFLRIHGKVDSFIERPYKTEVKYKIRKVALLEMTEDETHCILHHKEHMGICLNKTGVSFLAARNLMLKSIRTNVCLMTFTLSSYSINQLHFAVTAPKSNVCYGYTLRTKQPKSCFYSDQG